MRRGLPERPGRGAAYVYVLLAAVLLIAVPLTSCSAVYESELYDAGVDAVAEAVAGLIIKAAGGVPAQTETVDGTERRKNDVNADAENGTAEVSVSDSSGAAYTAGELIEYFTEVALYSEYEGYIGTVRKWVEPVRYYVRGEITDEDAAALAYVEDYLNSVDGFPGISAAESEDTANMSIVFGALDYLTENEGLFEDSYGSATFTWNTVSCDIFSAHVRIVNDETDQYIRNHIILEEIIQSLGLGNDSWMHEESLFYQGWNAPQSVPAVDDALIRALYAPEMKAGMSEAEAVEVLYSLYSGA